MVGQDPTSPIADPAAGPLAQARADYVHDQLQQARTVDDHAALLRSRASHRIAAAKAVKPAAGDQPDASALSGYHVNERTLDERAFYPPHDARAESPDYAKVHHQLTVVEDHRCLVCGVRRSTLGDPTQNPFGAIQMETHHRTIEWALANAISPDKFNQHIRPGLLRDAKARAADPAYAAKDAVHKAFDDIYARDMSAEEIKAWVDHAADNLWVLCDVHHRHKYVGIHAITYPIWGPQDVVDATSVAYQIANVTAKAAHPGKTPAVAPAGG